MSIESTQNVVYNSQIGWRFDNDGILRCTTNVLKSCVMTYKSSDVNMEGAPHEVQNKSTVELYVPAEELQNEESRKSLEGKPISIGHIWQKMGNIDSVGNIAGEATYDPLTKMLSADILVTDKSAVDRITKAANSRDKLVEQSAAYRSKISWVPGITPDGEAYDGVQRDIVYNHVALLAKGLGRAGEDVRILNKDGSVKVSEFTLVKVGKTSIRVMNEDVDKLDKAVDEKDEEAKKVLDHKDEKTKNAIHQKDEETEKDKAELKKMKNSNEELKGQVEALKTQLENASSLTVMKDAVNAALTERKEATEVLNSLGVKKESAKKVDSLTGHELRKHVVSEFRLMNSKPDLTEDESSEPMVLGMFTALKDTASLLSNKKQTVAGAGVVQIINEGSKAPGADMHSQDSMMKRKLASEARRQEHFKIKV